MKKILLSLTTFIVMHSFLFAQTDDDKKKEKKYKWGCGIAVNSIQGQMGYMGGVIGIDDNGNLTDGVNVRNKSYSLSVIPKYFIDKNLLLRFEIGLTHINYNIAEDYYESSFHHLTNELITQKIIRVSPGIQWNYYQWKFFYAYCGLSALYSQHSFYKDNVFGERRDSTTNDLKSWSQSNTRIDGGYSTGLNSILGFNVYFQKNISFGSELSWAFLYYKMGGARIVKETYQTLPNPSVSNQHDWNYTYQGFKYSNILFSFNFSLWL